jgi:hypothetical protein
MKAIIGLLLLTTSIFWLSAQSLHSQEPKPKDRFEITKMPRMYGTHFGRYGKYPAKVITFSGNWIRFKFAAGGKDWGQHGIYSYFAVAGDFEYSAEYEILKINHPEKGYGMTFGIAIDTDTPFGNVTFGRGYEGNPKAPGSYVLTRAIPDGAETKYEVQTFPSESKRGKLAIRREKEDLVILAADKPTDKLKELTRIPFYTGTIRQVRMLADRGDDPGSMDGFVGNMIIEADELTGGIPESDQSDWSWLLPSICICIIVAGIGTLIYVKRKRAQEE